MSASPKDPPPPSSSSPPPPPPPPSSRRPPPPCWTHEETLALIESYIDKWDSLRRGHLSLADWQSVADTVADRCSGPPAKKKTLIQCKHKMEKLRRRYRSEKEKRPTSSSWLYFRLMDSMGIVVPSPSPAAAAVPVQTPNSSSSSDDDDHQPRASPPPSQRRSGSGLGELAAAMRMVTGGYVRMERTKMEAVREMEERRLEMEMERTRLVLEAQRGMMESIIVAFSGGGGGGGDGRKRKKFEGGTRSPMQL
ncbi:hypothetical protein QJS10_CPB20g01350 [Acorus calamus]|uniref:Myb/SANT-like DNA-binding domain-containing protein n=1 Tax=Acorus calamus TaxID=4465 RepID=A0AAV9CBP6_ACOCL|nr:hypothetical protein QJS10_CPB20g01350 [Acorus calamus]